MVEVQNFSEVLNQHKEEQDIISIHEEQVQGGVIINEGSLIRGFVSTVESQITRSISVSQRGMVYSMAK